MIDKFVFGIGTVVVGSLLAGVGKVLEEAGKVQDEKKEKEETENND